MSISRRGFFGAAGAATLVGQPVPPGSAQRDLRIPLDGVWQFRLDKEADWRDVTVPHTWQTAPETVDYLGVAFYRRVFEAPPEWQGKAVRVEFEAVYHTAKVWLNGTLLGEHKGKGYTAFAFDIQPVPGANLLLVEVNNAFDRNMLPRGNSYDWTPDGGITRPVSLIVTPPVYLERLDVDPATVAVRAVVRNRELRVFSGSIRFEILEEDTGKTVVHGAPVSVTVAPGKAVEFELPKATLPNPRLWHFDHPNLYRVVARVGEHEAAATFGVRQIEVKDGGLYLNGERVWLAGVERMAGSHPDYGMAEPASWIEHDHADLKNLNCVFTRVHWQQDRRVLDYCDRHGILIQVEVPTWGGDTFGSEVVPAIEENGLEQLREMIRRDGNHPCVVSWGLCNEVNGQNPVSQHFVKRMAQEARKLDPARLLSYASNSLQKTPEKDIAGQLDFIEWNEYYESWYGGTPESVRANLEEIHKAFPGKMIVISEYGYCACTPDRGENDAKRTEILRNHNHVFREKDYVGGLIFFCYNDYRTHVGDKGLGVMKQRVHGVVDLYGARKPSYEALRRESSPVAAVEIAGGKAIVRTKKTVPAYELRGYKLRWVVYGAGDIPLEKHEAPLPVMKPGEEAAVALAFQAKPLRVVVDVVRPTGFSAWTEEWKL